MKLLVIAAAAPATCRGADALDCLLVFLGLIGGLGNGSELLEAAVNA
jgi:hypothetical protein